MQTKICCRDMNSEAPMPKCINNSICYNPEWKRKIYAGILIKNIYYKWNVQKKHLWNFTKENIAVNNHTIPLSNQCTSEYLKFST
jgi:hypothetical protein